MNIRKVLLLTLCLFLFSVVSSAAYAADTNQLTFVFQKQKRPDEIKQAADKVAAYLSKEIGVPVQTKVPSGYAASVQALVSQTADFAYVSSLPYLLAKRDGGATLLLAEQRADTKGAYRTEYDSVFVVRKDSPFKTWEQVLKSVKDVRLVFTSTTSTSGYVFASRRLVHDGVLKSGQNPREVFKSVSFAGSYTRALEELLADRGDIAAVSYYAVEGPKSAKYLPQGQLDKLRVIARNPGVPTHVIAVRKGLSEQLVAKVKQALLDMSAKKPELLKDVYGTSRLVEVDPQGHVAATIEAVEFLGLPLKGFVH